MTEEDAIIRAGKLLADPNRWCQNACALDKVGVEVEPCSRRAIRWSAYGVMYHVYRVKTTDFGEKAGRSVSKVAQMSSLLDLAAGQLFKKTISNVNDNLGHAEVMQVLRHALRLQRARPVEKEAA